MVSNHMTAKEKQPHGLDYYYLNAYFVNTLFRELNSELRKTSVSLRTRFAGLPWPTTFVGPLLNFQLLTQFHIKDLIDKSQQHE